MLIPAPIATDTAVTADEFGGGYTYPEDTDQTLAFSDELSTPVHATVTPNTPHCAKGSNSNNWFKFPDFKLFADNGVSSGTLQYAKLCFLSFGSERLLREYTFRIKRGCPPGTYEDTSVTSSYVDHCKPCPTGRYSTGGKNQRAIH